MRTLNKSLIVFFLVIGVAAVINAGDTENAKAPEKSMELKNQTHCPVMGGKIDSTVYTDIQGQRVYHCCPMCSDKLKADPDKYFEKAAADGVLFENIQTTCPVSGKELKDKSVAIDYEGRHIAFCCEGCIEPFKEDASTYLDKLTPGADAESENVEKMDHGDHSGHDH